MTREDARGIGRQRAGRCQEVAQDEESSRRLAVQGDRRGHGADGTGAAARVAPVIRTG